jgi:hypothetical protein
LLMVTLLVSYRSTPLPLSHKSPFELLHNRAPRNSLSLLLPQERSRLQGQIPKFAINQHVFARTFGQNSRWCKARIIRPVGRMLYLLSTASGVLKRHQNQLRPDPSFDNDVDDWDIQLPINQQATQSHQPLNSSTEPNETECKGDGRNLSEVQTETQQPKSLRRSSRRRRPVVRFSFPTPPKRPRRRNQKN